MAGANGSVQFELNTIQGLECHPFRVNLSTPFASNFQAEPNRANRMKLRCTTSSFSTMELWCFRYAQLWSVK
jgi:hypothetical protein